MPLSRYVFADLNALNDDVRAHMQGRSRQYSQEELALPFPLDPYKLTELLSSPGGEMKVFLLQPEYERRDLLSSCWLGFTTKEYPRIYSLENLLKRNLAEDANGVLGAGKKTLVLVGGELTSSILDRVKLYFTAGWSIQFYCFRERGSEVSDRLHAKYPRHFQSVYLGTGKLVTEGCCQRYVLLDIDELFASDKLHTEAQDGINLPALTKLVCGDDPTKVKHPVAMYEQSNQFPANALLVNGWVLSEQPTATSLIVQVKLIKRLISTTPTATLKTLVLVLVAADKALTFGGKTMCDHLLRVLLTKMWRIKIYLWREPLTGELLNSFYICRNQVKLKPLDDKLNVLSRIQRCQQQ